MKEYSPIQFLAYLIEQRQYNSLQLNARKFNKELDELHDSLWNQHYHIDFGFREFAFECINKFPNNCQFNIENFILTINKDEEFERKLNNYIKIYKTPEYDF